MDDSLVVAMYQSLADMRGDANDLVKRQAVLICCFYKICNRPTLDVLADYERPAILIADIINSDDVGMAAESRHRLRLADKSGNAIRAERLSFQKSDNDIAIQSIISRKINPLLSSLTERPSHKVTPITKRSWHDRRRLRV